MIERAFTMRLQYGTHLEIVHDMRTVIIPTLDPEACDLQLVKINVSSHDAMVVTSVLTTVDFEGFKVVDVKYEPHYLGPKAPSTTVHAVIATPYSLAGLM